MAEFSILDLNKARTAAQQGNIALASNILRSANAPQSAYDAIFPQGSTQASSSSPGMGIFNSGASDPYANYQNGGWYDNPQTGKNQRFWGTDSSGNPIWSDGAQPTGAGTNAPKTPAQQAQDLIDASVSAYTKQLSDYTSKLSDYDKQNPFVFDDVLAQKKTEVQQRLDPYYTQTLGDYLKGIDTTKSRSLEDEKNTLSQLSADTDFYTGQNKVALDSAIETSRNGYSDAGLSGSGADMRAVGATTAGSQANLQDFLRKQDYTKSQTLLNTNRLVNEDLPLQSNIYQRNLKADEAYNVDTQANQAAQQSQQQNEFARQSYAGTPPGVSPLQSSNNLYSLLG